MSSFVKDFTRSCRAVLMMTMNKSDGRFLINAGFSGIKRSFIVLAFALIGYSLIDYLYFDSNIKSGNIFSEATVDSYVTANFLINFLAVFLSIIFVGVLSLIFKFSKNFWVFVVTNNWMMFIWIPLVFVAGYPWDIGSDDEFTYYSMIMSIVILMPLLLAMFSDFQVIRFTMELNVLPAIAIWLFILFLQFFLGIAISDLFGILAPLE